jgi:hypothetical protein
MRRQAADVPDRRLRRLRLLALVLAVAALGALLIRMSGAFPASGPPTITPSPMPGPGTTPSATIRPPLPTEFDPGTPGARLTLTPEPSTPADQWADYVLDAALPAAGQPSPSQGGAAWWDQPGTLRGRLAYAGGRITIGGSALDVAALTAIDLFVPGGDASGGLTPVARVAWEGEALMLTGRGIGAEGAERSWLLSGAGPELAVEALTMGAARRDFALDVAYMASGSAAQIVLLDAGDPDATPTPLPTPSPTQPTPTPFFSPTPTFPPTPTRVPEAFMGQVIAGKLDPVLDALRDGPPPEAAAYAATHPWTGALTWTETGPRLDGIPLPVGQASELNVYALAAEPGGEPELILHATYNTSVSGSYTHFPEDQLIFQEQRMDEIVYWMVRDAVEQGGQLFAAFDDFGVRQNLTLIDYRSLNP